MTHRSELHALALRTLIPGFTGTTAPPWALELLEAGLGGYCLFAFNIADADQLARLNASLREASPDAVIAIDEEGGDVTRLHTATGSPYPGNAALGAVDDPELTTAIHRSIGSELVQAGVNLNFAPAVDVNVEDDNPVIGTRSFGRDPEAVARHAVAAVRGLQQAGVAACAKHFPGHGATSVDSHLTVPTVDVSLDVLRRRELVPFQAVIDAGIQVIMSGHIRVPALTGDAPGTLSHAAMTGLLREEMGFDGVIVTDAMEMQGASGATGMPEAIVRALMAGCDLICTGGESQKAGPMTELVHATADAVADAVVSGRMPLERLESAVARGDALRAWQREHHAAAANRPLGLEAARRALHLEGTVPRLDDAVIVQIDSPANIAVGEFPWGVTPLLTKRLPDAVVRHTDVESDESAELSALAAGRPIVVVSRDTHRRPAARALLAGLAAGPSPVVLVEMGWPAAWRPEGVTAYLATFGAAGANAQAAAERLLGD
ncbi:beta-N-acetylhexosaminidase [Stackebrandtia albiflava]|uniref:Beta-N-acetylhexosaminidase n=1 Tax=Stackebrandtia albiflava TaxID=406432 RepID=A0A562V9U3_9ACTN|nr:glycoside hydrolase family 3 N-terminal domain-containing protein [Stackebrandtia albiflava]TWJ14632.1 beta-N-acetylhexosaminidase [Stackebrandtia albiflava]